MHQTYLDDPLTSTGSLTGAEGTKYSAANPPTTCKRLETVYLANSILLKYNANGKVKYSDTVKSSPLTVTLFQCPSTVAVSGEACTVISGYSDTL